MCSRPPVAAGICREGIIVRTQCGAAQDLSIDQVLRDWRSTPEASPMPHAQLVQFVTRSASCTRRADADRGAGAGVVLASRGFGRTLAEAKLTAKPVIAANRSDNLGAL